MALSEILLLGDSRLTETCAPVEKEELNELLPVIQKLGELVLEFRSTYGAGRAIAAPQIGVMKRLIVMNIDRPIAIINPVLSDYSKEMFEMWDDCMSFPNLMVKVNRHQSCIMKFKNLDWQEEEWKLKGDLSELMQHEYDHLNGILATMRAIDDQAFKWRVSD
ncbi:MAG: peptide deformylase [Bacteroidota bacterium]